MEVVSFSSLPLYSRPQLNRRLHLRLVPMLRMSGALSASPPHVSMAWCLMEYRHLSIYLLYEAVYRIVILSVDSLLRLYLMVTSVNLYELQGTT
jgi:hypothetical protein